MKSMTKIDPMVKGVYLVDSGSGKEGGVEEQHLQVLITDQ
jgi:hypothetical protein